MTTTRRSRTIITFTLILVTFGTWDTSHAFEPGNPPFARTWARTDQPVAGGVAQRTWMWGPEALTGLMTEEYAEGLLGERTVQYYDKARMEITDPTAVDDGVWYVTNGLLVRELVSGMMQRGDEAFELLGAANVNVAGDLDDQNAPSYETIATVLDAPPQGENALLTQRLARDGIISDDPTLAMHDVRASERVTVPGIDHRIAAPFWNFMNASGVIFEDGALTSGALFPNPYYATGYPISEAYWVNVLVGGTAQDVLLQCFERRCLTFTPGNEPAWQVEAGNVGLHYFVWRYDRAPAPSDAERELSFVSERTGNAEIYVVGDDGTGLRNLTNNPARDYNVSWAPDGRSLAFVSDRGSAADIWVMDADGGSPRNLTPGAGDEYAPAWSPDGRYIAFESFRDGNYEIYVMDADGENQRNLTNNPSADLSPVWSPFSTHIAFTSSRTDPAGRFSGVFTVAVEGGEALRIQTCREVNYAVAWSPEGAYLAFISMSYNTGSSVLCVAGYDGESAYDPFDGEEQVTGGPTWSADGTHIAAIWRQLNDLTGEFSSELFVTNLIGTDAAAIVGGGLDGFLGFQQPVWSPDGAQIAWVSHSNGNADVFVTDPAGLDWYALTDSAGPDGEPTWRPEPAE